ncbi:outer membrane protein assembly factor BamD [Pelagibacteraceae bacterium]|jgi:outer membrane protein assembly factor BamD|nr:outer membrane protein assembly factor BamD [Pelagibacteraceae bacterium]MDC1159071.1 outer membrane protein assembly factor BamD [Pelagibacteraceae bacterium]
MRLRILLIVCFFSLLYSCSKEKISYEPVQKVDAYEVYKEAFLAFEKNDFTYASKKFSEAEINFTDPRLAAKSAIMASFCLYSVNFYIQAEENLDRFLINYPADQNVIYANYLKAIISFEQIGEEKYDLEPLLEAKKKINFFLKKYPDSEYAIDLNFKKDLVENQFAAKELFIAKYYISVQKWVPAINRLKIIVNNHDKTIFIEEALHRLVEIHYHIGLKKEAKKYASILGYNYNTSEWFEQSYKLLNKDYEKVLKLEKKENEKNLFMKIINKIKLK